MVRDAFADKAYWDKWIDFRLDWIAEETGNLGTVSPNPTYDAEYAFGIIMNISRVILMKYSRGDLVSELKQYFSNLLDVWELSNQLDDRNMDRGTIVTGHFH